MKRALFTAVVTSAVVLGGVVACDDASGPQGERVSVALAVPRGGSFSASDVSLNASADDDDPLIIVRGRQRLRLDLVELRVDNVALRSVEFDDDDDTDLDTDTDHDTDTDSDTDTDDADIIRFRDDVTVRLPLHGGVITPFATMVPVGTYDRVRLWIESVHLVGAFDNDLDGVFEGDADCTLNDDDCGEFFNVVVPVRQRVTIRIRPPLVVREGEGDNVTITLEPDWFRHPDRSLFSPRRLKHEHQLRARFRNLIRSTLRAFKDANANGVDDRDTDR